MSRDQFYLVFGIAVFVVTAVILYFFTQLPIIWNLAIATLVSIASDIVIVIDNERRNKTPDAKFHHRNELVGETATVIENFTRDEDIFSGKIEINNEKWKASCRQEPLEQGDRVRIIDRQGMIFIVVRCEE